MLYLYGSRSLKRSTFFNMRCIKPKFPIYLLVMALNTIWIHGAYAQYSNGNAPGGASGQQSGSATTISVKVFPANGKPAKPSQRPPVQTPATATPRAAPPPKTTHSLFAKTQPPYTSKIKIVIVGEEDHDRREESVKFIERSIENDRRRKKGTVAIGLEGGGMKESQDYTFALQTPATQKALLDIEVNPGQRPYLFGIENHKKVGEKLTQEDIKERKGFKLLLAYQELAILTYLVRANDDTFQRRTYLQEYWDQTHRSREGDWIEAILAVAEKQPDMSTMYLSIGKAHSDNEFGVLFSGLEKKGFNVEVYTPNKNSPQALLASISVLGSNALNHANAMQKYFRYYENNIDLDPYFGDYVGAYGPDRNEFGQKFNYPHPRDYTTEAAFVEAAFQAVGQKKDSAGLLYQYFHNKLHRDFYQENIKY